MSSGGLRPQPSLISPFSDQQQSKLNPLVSSFGSILPNTNPFALSQLLATVVSSNNNNLHHQQQRSKLKRCRQRVDAGEPRNSYQNPSTKMNGLKREQSVNAPSESGFNMKLFHGALEQQQNNDNSDHEEIPPAKRLRQDEQETTDENLFSSSQDMATLEDSTKDFGEEDEEESDDFHEPTMMVNGDDNQQQSPENMEQCHSNNSAMSNNSSSARRKCFQPQRQIANNNFVVVSESAEENNGISSSIKESSVLLEDDDGDCCLLEEAVARSPSLNGVIGEDAPSIAGPLPQQNNSNIFFNVMNMLPSHLNNFGNNGGNTNRLQEFFEAQRRFQMNNNNNNNVSENSVQKSAKNNHNNEMISMEKIPSLAQLHQSQQQDVQQNIFRLCQTLKDEIGTAIDKVVTDYRTRETRAFMERMLRTVTVTNEVQQQMNEMKQQYTNQRLAAFLMPKNPSSLPPNMYNSNNNNNNVSVSAATASSSSFVNPTMSNLLAAAAAASQNNNNSVSSAAPSNNNITGSSSIFPPPNQLHHHPNLSSFPTLASHLNNSNHMIRSNSAVADCSPIRKKRSKVTDSLRVNKAGIIRDSSSNSLPVSERSSPLNNSSNYFPPTMVNHPLYNSTNFGNSNNNSRNINDDIDRDESGENSDSFSDYGGPYDGTYPLSNTLTPIHLRKAKLMFFYTRYPSSALLKSYFTDIRFNKNNTAQLVKWFSNFREFFYMQMEKFARQALAEGMTHREQLHVSEESEIYKTLNQHYNRNNLFPPPPRLREVIEETLREFFVALQQERDKDTSWKKAIYKVISRMDDTIPEHFKLPSFMCTLE